MPTEFSALFRDFHTNPPATPSMIEEAESALKVKLPSTYVALLRCADGGEGFVGGGSYLMLWRASELAPFNQGYEVSRNAPGLILFGSDGGGDAFGFDTRDPNCPIVRIPFVGMSWDYAEPAGNTILECLARLSQIE